MNASVETGLRKVDAELEREAEVVAVRFPDVPRREIEQAMHEVYQDLAAQATVRTHLFAITAAVVMNRLRA